MEHLYVESRAPGTDGVCSDPDCPCDDVRIRKGVGFLYLSPQFVAARGRHPTTGGATGDEEHQLRDLLGEDVPIIIERAEPILVCELGARMRQIDLETASEDARIWWESGRVPLRPTPEAHPIPSWALMNNAEDRQPVRLPLKGAGGAPALVFAHDGEVAWKVIGEIPPLVDAYPHPADSALFARLCRYALSCGDEVFHIILGHGKGETMHHVTYNIRPFLEHHGL